MKILKSVLLAVIDLIAAFLSFYVASLVISLIGGSSPELGMLQRLILTLLMTAICCAFLNMSSNPTRSIVIDVIGYICAGIVSAVASYLLYDVSLLSNAVFHLITCLWLTVVGVFSRIIIRGSSYDLDDDDFDEFDDELDDFDDEEEPLELEEEEEPKKERRSLFGRNRSKKADPAELDDSFDFDSFETKVEETKTEDDDVKIYNKKPEAQTVSQVKELSIEEAVNSIDLEELVTDVNEDVVDPLQIDIVPTRADSIDDFDIADFNFEVAPQEETTNVLSDITIDDFDLDDVDLEGHIDETPAELDEDLLKLDDLDIISDPESFEEEVDIDVPSEKIIEQVEDKIEEKAAEAEQIPDAKEEDILQEIIEEVPSIEDEPEKTAIEDLIDRAADDDIMAVELLKPTQEDTIAKEEEKASLDDTSEAKEPEDNEDEKLVQSLLKQIEEKELQKQKELEDMQDSILIEKLIKQLEEQSRQIEQLRREVTESKMNTIEPQPRAYDIEPRYSRPADMYQPKYQPKDNQKEILDSILSDVKNMYTSLSSRERQIEDREYSLLLKMVEMNGKDRNEYANARPSTSRKSTIGEMNISTTDNVSLGRDIKELLNSYRDMTQNAIDEINRKNDDLEIQRLEQERQAQLLKEAQERFIHDQIESEIKRVKDTEVSELVKTNTVYDEKIEQNSVQTRLQEEKLRQIEEKSNNEIQELKDQLKLAMELINKKNEPVEEKAPEKIVLVEEPKIEVKEEEKAIEPVAEPEVLVSVPEVIEEAPVEKVEEEKIEGPKPSELMKDFEDLDVNTIHEVKPTTTIQPNRISVSNPQAQGPRISLKPVDKKGNIITHSKPLPENFESSFAKLKAEKELEAKRADEDRKAAELAAIQAQKKLEEARLEAEAKKLEAMKLEAEAKKAEEARRLEAQKRAEAQRREAEARRAMEAQRLIEEARKVDEARRLLEETKKAEEARRLEEIRLQKEAERIAEEERVAEEARKEELARLEKENLRKQLELQEAQRKAAEAEAEKARLAEEAKKAEDERLEAEAKKLAEAKETFDKISNIDITEDLFGDINELPEITAPAEIADNNEKVNRRNIVDFSEAKSDAIGLDENDLFAISSLLDNM